MSENSAGASPADGGDAGSDPGDATEAGQAGATRCTSDLDCTDSLACNGKERCRAGQCEPGTTVECGPSLHCAEDGSSGSRCEYSTPGRWLAFIGSYTGLFPFELRALRLEGDEHGPSLSLSAGVADDYQLAGVDTWSPDGRHLIMTKHKDLEHFETNRLFVVDFGNGLPSEPRPLPGIPVGSFVMSGPWSADSSAVIVRNLAAVEETYLVRFLPTGMETQLLFSDEPENSSSASFCPNSRWVHRTIGGATTLVDTEDPTHTEPLWQGSSDNSPDGHWLLGGDEDSGKLWFAACEPGSQPVLLESPPATGESSWSHDGRFVALTQDSAMGEIEVLDASQSFKRVFKGAQAGYRWAPGVSRLMLLGEEKAGLQTLVEVDFTTLPATQTSRGATPNPSSWDYVNDTTLWAQRNDAGDTWSVWLLDAGTSSWRRLAAGLSDSTPAFTRGGAYATFKQSLEDGTTQILAYSTQETSPSAIALLPKPLSGDVYREYALEEGVIVSRFTGLEPFEGQFWWIASGAKGFAAPRLLTDLRAATEPVLQPVP